MKSRLLYCYTSRSTFVSKDIAILSKEYALTEFHFDIYRKKRLPVILLQQFFFILRNLRGTKLLVTQFGGLHAVLPSLIGRMAGKKVVIVAGGTDCVSFPSIRYGNFSGAFNRWCTSAAFRNAHLILPVHDALIFSNYSYYDSDFPAQGIRYFLPDLKTRIVTVHNGYDAFVWKSRGEARIPFSFVTVIAHLNSRFTMKLKGLDIFTELARKFSSCRFSIVGGDGMDRNALPPNLEILPHAWGSDLAAIYSAHQFYVQLSVSEGFPNGLSEAMLCGCVPVVSNVGGMPDIVGDSGVIVKKRGVDFAAAEVDALIQRKDLQELSDRARKRIADAYSFEKRETGLLKALSELD